MQEINLKDFVDWAADGDYNIPEFQRGFVWPYQKIVALCESLYREYPIGSLLLWRTSQYKEQQRRELQREPFWIIDGQQRTTSLCLLYGRLPYWLANRGELLEPSRVFLNLTLSSDGELLAKFGKPNRQAIFSIPVDTILQQKDEEALATLVQNKLIEAEQQALFVRVNSAVGRVWGFHKKSINSEVLGDISPDDVAEIFRRLNQLGTPIKQTDIRLVYVALANPGWVREDFLPFLSELEAAGWDFDPGHILQVMAVWQRGRARAGEIPKDFWEQHLVPVWGQTKDRVLDALLHLEDHGVLTLDLVPSDYTLIPLLALHIKFYGTPQYDFKEVLRWFLLANLAGRYGDAPLETLDRDAQKIYSSNNIQEIINEILPTYDKSNLEKDMSANFQKGSPQALLLHVLLWEANAKDWQNDVSIRTLANREVADWHHILPKAWAKKQNYPNAETTPNVTVIYDRTNRRLLGSKPPWEYARLLTMKPEVIAEHFIPTSIAGKFTNGTVLTAEEYQQAMNERQQLITEKAVALLQVPSTSNNL